MRVKGELEMNRLPRKEKGIRICTKSANLFVLILGFFMIIFVMLQGGFSIAPENRLSLNSSSELLHEEEQFFNLIQVDGYFLGRGFIDGESVYIFQTENNNILSNLYILPVDSTTIITNADSNRLLVSKQTYLDTQFNQKNHKLETTENTKVKHTIYLTSNNIKDYGVIQQKVSSTITFIPFFFYKEI